MAGEKKYLRRTDIGLVLEMEPTLLALLRVFLEQAGLPYEVYDAPPEEQGNETPRRRRSS